MSTIYSTKKQKGNYCDRNSAEYDSRVLADELKTSNFPISGQILVYPFLGGNMSLEFRHANAPGNNKKREILSRLLDASGKSKAIYL